jgi:hypothetical protein
MPPKNRVLAGAWLLPEEKNEVCTLAKQTHLTVSELMRRLVTGRKLPDTQHHEGILNLMKINADLARLGNLFKMAIDDKEFTLPDNMGLESLRDRIHETQSILKNKIMEL